jgi:hypothetical protein
MSDDEINVEKYIKNKQLWISQFRNLADLAEEPEKGLEQLAASGKAFIPSLDRLVLKCIHRVTSRKDVRANLRLEQGHQANFSRFPNSLVVTYFVEDIMSTIAGDKGVHSEWMAELLETYDAVIFARQAWKGVAFNLSLPSPIKPSMQLSSTDNA